MFCSRCGKTVRSEWTSCKYCNNEIGESRFEGVPYTSAQKHIVYNGNSVYEPRAYTRTTYTGGDYEEQYDGDIDVRTSYRPAYDYPAASDELLDEMAAAVKQHQDEENGADGYEDDYIEAPEEAPEDMPRIDINDIEGFDMSKITARPIVAKKPAGYSSDVEEYVRKLDLDNIDRPPRRGKHIAADDPYRDEPVDDMEGEDLPLDDGQRDDDEYYDAPGFFNKGNIIKIVIALVVVAALFVAGVYIAPKLFSQFKEEASVPIEGVTLELYNSGIEYIEGHVGQTYIDGVLATYQNGGFVALTTRLNSDQTELASLMPATPSTNDQLFIDAVAKIQDDIGSAITLDAVEMQANGAVTSQESQDRWTSINETIASLKAVNSAAGLNAIISGERIVAEIATPTPEPLTTPAPQYTSLSKGDENDDVKTMQQRLYDLGYLDDEPDGNFGNNTQTAVKLFQQEAGIEVTGVADNGTLTVLYSDDAPMTDNARITPAPEPTDAPLQPAEVGGDGTQPE